MRPRFEHVAPDHVLHAAVSPTGKRVLFEAHGEILAVPAEKGDVRNLTRSPGVADRDPAWSPDGKWIAWLSDESRRVRALLPLARRPRPRARRWTSASPASFFYSPRWSPDSKKVVLQDKRLNLWLVDVDHPAPVKIDTDRFEGAVVRRDLVARLEWVAYAKALENHLQAIFVYSVEDKKTHQVTDGRSDSGSPRFDAAASTCGSSRSTDDGAAADGGMA